MEEVGAADPVAPPLLFSVLDKCPYTMIEALVGLDSYRIQHPSSGKFTSLNW